MSEPLTTGIKRIIWIASDRRHRIIGIWWVQKNDPSLAKWKYDAVALGAKYITKHEVYL